MLSLEGLSGIVSKISYKNWAFRVLQKGDGFLIQVNFLAPDSKSGVMSLQKCRKWYVSSHACESEIVRTIYKAIEAAEIHELQENFRYCGQTIFGPHLNPEDIAMLIAGHWLGENVRSQSLPKMDRVEEILHKKVPKSKNPRIGVTRGIRQSKRN